MSEIRTAVRVDLTGNLERRAQRYGRSVQDFTRRSNRYLAGMTRVAQRAGNMLDRAGNRYVGLLTGVAAGASARGVINTEERFARLGIQANESAESMDRLKEAIFETSQQPNIRVDPGQITSAVEAIVEKTGDLEFARNNLENIGIAIQATGAQGQNIGEILAEMQKQGIKGPQAVLEVLDTLNQQGKEGAFTLQNLAALGPRVVSAYMAMRPGDAEAFKEMGAALQVIRQGTGSSEQAATAFEALLSALGDADKIKILQQGGIKVFDEEAMKEGRKELRPINQLMQEIIARADGDRTIIQQVLGSEEAIRGFNAAVSEFNKTGAVESLDKFMGIHGDGSATLADSARAAETASAAVQNLSTAWQKFADQELAGPIQGAADALNSLDTETVDRWMQIGKWVGISAAGLYGAKKLGIGKLAGRIFGGRRGGGVAGALGGAASMAGGVIPVYVVNMGSGMGGMGPDIGRPNGGRIPPAGGPKIFKPSRWQLLRNMSLRGLPALGTGALASAGAYTLGAGALGYGAGTVLNKTLIDGTELGESIGRNVARVLAFFGNDSARAALDAEIRIKVDAEGRPSLEEMRQNEAERLGVHVSTIGFQGM